MLYETKYDEEADQILVMVWNGVPADPKQQRPMFPWYLHCDSMRRLKLTDKELYTRRMTTITKWFKSKDSSYANIYRHYHELAAL